MASQEISAIDGMAIQSNNQREAVDDQVQCRNMIDCLPHEIFLDIVCRLPITSLVKFRLVCRDWNRKLSYDPELVNLQLFHAMKKGPCLIFQYGKKLSFVDLSDLENNEQVRELTLPFLLALQWLRVLGSCNGLLCISRSFFNFDTLYICNPFTGNFKELPKSKFEKPNVTVGFGFHPSTKEYKVVKIGYNSDSRFRSDKVTRIQSDVQILDLSSSKWRSIGEVPYWLDMDYTGVLVNGRLHWFTIWDSCPGRWHEIIVSFDLCDEGFQEIPMSDDFRDNTIRCDYFNISVLGGRLSAGLGDDLILQLWVMKEYNVKESWECVCTFSINSPMHDPHDEWLVRLKNGEILKKSKLALVSYDPKSKETRKLMFKGMPDVFTPTVHVGSLNWID